MLAHRLAERVIVFDKQDTHEPAVSKHTIAWKAAGNLTNEKRRVQAAVRKDAYIEPGEAQYCSCRR